MGRVMMEVVSERTEQQIAIELASQELTCATRNLVANILRIMAGGGEVHQLLEEIVAFSEPVKQLHKLGHAPFVQIKEELLSWQDGRPRSDSLEEAVVSA